MFSFTEIDFGTIGEVQKVNMARLETLYPVLHSTLNVHVRYF